MNTEQHTYVEPNGTIWTIFVEGEQPEPHTRPERFTFHADAHMDEGSPQYTSHDHPTGIAALCDVIATIADATNDAAMSAAYAFQEL